MEEDVANLLGEMGDDFGDQSDGREAAMASCSLVMVSSGGGELSGGRETVAASSDGRDELFVGRSVATVAGSGDGELLIDGSAASKTSSGGDGSGGAGDHGAWTGGASSGEGDDNGRERIVMVFSSPATDVLSIDEVGGGKEKER